MSYVPARWERRLATAAQLLGGSVVVVLMIQVTMNALLRRIAGIQIPITLETTQWWYMPAIACAGIATAAVQRGHFEVDLIYESLPVTGRRFLAVFAIALTITLTVAITWFSFVEALDQAAMRRVESVTNLAIWPIYFLVPLSFAAYAAVLLASLYRLTLRRDLAELGEPDPERPETNPAA